LRRAVDLRAALKLGARIDMDEIPADEFAAMLVLEDEQKLLQVVSRTE